MLSHRVLADGNFSSFQEHPTLGISGRNKHNALHRLSNGSAASRSLSVRAQAKHQVFAVRSDDTGVDLRFCGENQFEGSCGCTFILFLIVRFAQVLSTIRPVCLQYEVVP